MNTERPISISGSLSVVGKIIIDASERFEKHPAAPLSPYEDRKKFGIDRAHHSRSQRLQYSGSKRTGFTRLSDIRDQFDYNFDDVLSSEKPITQNDSGQLTRTVQLTESEWRFLQEGLCHQR